MRLGLRGRSLAFTFAIAVLSVGLPVRAQEAGMTAVAEGEDARTLFMRGEVAYAQGDYEDSVALWERAYELDARPLLQWNLSQAYERLGRVVEAADALDRYLAGADPSDVHQADARARLGAIRERIAATGITVSGGPEGATLSIDGEDRGRLPHPDPLRVSPGSHDVVVTAAGYDTFRATVSVPAGNQAAVTVQMAATGGSSEFPVAGVILMSVGGAAAIAGAVMGGVALGQASSAPSSTGPEADSARGLALGADITLGIGAACGVAGIIVTIVSLSSGGGSEASAGIELENGTISLLPFGGPSGGGLSATGHF